jgi:hypothetical protein
MSMGKPPTFDRSASILYRGIDECGEVIDVKPVTIVEDTDERAIFWLPIGTPTMKPELLHPTSEGPRRWDQGWRLVPSVWRRSEVLIIIQKNQLRATWVRWSKDREFEGWDVNIQSPLHRTNLGFDIQDYQLDIVVEPNRQWRWKDENELALAVELGRLTIDQAKAVRSEGESAVADIEGNVTPFCDEWVHWQPTGDLGLPVLSKEWAITSHHCEIGL